MYWCTKILFFGGLLLYMICMLTFLNKIICVLTCIISIHCILIFFLLLRFCSLVLFRRGMLEILLKTLFSIHKWFCWRYIQLEYDFVFYSIYSTNGFVEDISNWNMILFSIHKWFCWRYIQLEYDFVFYSQMVLLKIYPTGIWFCFLFTNGFVEDISNWDMILFSIHKWFCWRYIQLGYDFVFYSQMVLLKIYPTGIWFCSQFLFIDVFEDNI